jgi:fluoroquinolone transport system permease protein
MKKYLMLLGADIKNMGRDPMLLFASGAPLLLLALMRLGVPAARDLLAAYVPFDLAQFYPLIAVFFSLLPAMLWGLTTAFLYLDEKDNGLTAYFFITPLRKSGYLAYRLSFPLVFSFAFTVLLAATNGLVVFTLWQIMVFAVLSSVLSLVFFFALAALAHNKVEGLALGKALGVILLGPVASGILPSPLKYLGAIFPPFWSAEFLFASMNRGPAWYLVLAAGAAVALHALPLVLLFRRYLKNLA